MPRTNQDTQASIADAEYVILFREPSTGLIDGVLDDNGAEFAVFDSRQQAIDYIEKQEDPVPFYQIVELDNVLSTPELRAALHARDLSP